MCGVGRPRAWSCISVPDQHRRRGHYAGTYFNIRVLLQRCLRVIKRFLVPFNIPRRCVKNENCPVARKGKSDPTNSCLGYRDDHRHQSPWSWGWYGGRGSHELGVLGAMFRGRTRT
jgi:hypothetical protein